MRNDSKNKTAKSIMPVKFDSLLNIGVNKHRPPTNKSTTLILAMICFAHLQSNDKIVYTMHTNGQELFLFCRYFLRIITPIKLSLEDPGFCDRTVQL